MEIELHRSKENTINCLPKMSQGQIKQLRIFLLHKIDRFLENKITNGAMLTKRIGQILNRTIKNHTKSMKKSQHLSRDRSIQSNIQAVKISN